MKILYVLLLLTTHTSSLLCMEQERPKKRTTSSEALPPSVNPCTILSVHVLSAYPNMPYATPVHAKHVSQSLPQNMPTCEANQPGWQYLNKIMNTSYQSNQPACASEFELKPTYRPMTKTVTQQETKPLLQTNPSQPDKAIMEKLYKSACHITSDQYKRNTDTKDRYETLIRLINDMRNAKNNGIHEDLMIKFAYTKESMLATYFFSCLKMYNQSEETLPHINDLITTKKVPRIQNQLAHLLNIPSQYNTTTTTQHINNYEIERKYLALNVLRIDTISSHSSTDISALFSYIYSTAKETHNDYVGLSYDDLKDKFYELAYYVVKHRIYMPNDRQRYKNRIYDLLKIIEAGTTLNPQKQEDDFGYDMITKELTISETLGTFISPTFLICDNIPRIKKYIGLLCSLIKKYNKERETRCTPTKEQMLAYKAYESLYIALPDSFDTTLFDTTLYAFKELTKLSENISYLSELELYKIDQNLVDECVQYLYKNAI